MNRLAVAYHEAGHALVARRMGRRVESISVGPFGGAVVQREPLAADASPEEIERALVMGLAGAEAERYAPQPTFESNGNGEHWFTDAETAAMLAEPEGVRERPSNEQVLEHYTECIGAEAVERARALAAELVMRLHRIGHLEWLVDELLFRGAMTGDDLERLLAAVAA